MDKLFVPQLKEFLRGEDMNGKKACDTCSLRQVCNFTKPPIHIEKERSQRTVSDLILTDEQENAIAFRKGIARINAGSRSWQNTGLALRIANMLDEGIRPEDMILLTFTNTGAEEMRNETGFIPMILAVRRIWKKLTCTTFSWFWRPDYP